MQVLHGVAGRSVRRARQHVATLLIVASCALPLSCASGAGAQRWNDTYESRLEILALLQTLNADLLASASATAVLERWCRDHAMATQPTVVVQRVSGTGKEPSAEQLQRLEVRDATEVRYRRVRLQCGAHTLSEADNWYVPARLTAEMNQRLETTDVPFGKVVRDLTPYRRTMEARLLWSPLPPGWPMQRRSRSHYGGRGRPLVVPKELMVHVAVLYTSDHQPFSQVVETYQGELLAFGRR